VTITTDTQRLCFRVSSYFCLGLTQVNYKVDTVYLYKYKLILMASFHVCFVYVQEIVAFVSVRSIQLDVRDEFDSLNTHSICSPERHCTFRTVHIKTLHLSDRTHKDTAPFGPYT